MWSARSITSQSDATNDRHDMKKILVLLTAAVLCSLTLSAKKPVNTQWTPEQARAWWAETEWPVGCCYVPTYAINQFEMWQEDTFNP